MMNGMTMRKKNRHSRFAVLLAMMVVLGCIAGCGGGEDIRTYEVPKVAKVPEAAKKSPTTNTSVSTTGSRLLAAIIPRGQEVWHFKLMGPSTLVNPQFDSFVKFIEGVKFSSIKDEQGATTSHATWKLPEGWSERAGSGMRFSTIIVGEAAHGIELTVFRFGPESGDVLANVQRWAGQVGVENVTRASLAEMTRSIIVDNQPATLVDVTGPGGAADPSMAGPSRTPPQPQPPQAPAKPERIVAEAPEGFTTDPNPGQFLIAKYVVAQGEKSATLTLSSAGGDIEANLNRWRNQIGLAPWDETSIQKAFEAGQELKQAEIAGRRAIVIDIIGPESAGENRQRIMGALTANPSGAIWFVKFHGPADLVGTQTVAFDKFLKSIRFEN